MQNVPKIVTDRLRAKPAASHPDADLLTGFAERSLSDRERATVLDHLSLCHDCRDIVVLALPEIEAGQFVVRPARPGWFGVPALRWGLVAAGIVVVASFGIVEYQRTARPKEATATYFEPQAPGATAAIAESRNKSEKTAPDDTTTADASSNHALKSRAPTSGIMARQRISPQVAQSQALGSIGGPVAQPVPRLSLSLPHLPKSNSGISAPAYGPNIPTQWQQAQAVKQQNGNIRTSAPASQTVTVQVTGAAPVIQNGSAAGLQANNVTQNQIAQNQAPLANQPSLFGAEDSREIARAKPALSTGNGALATIPRWAINSTGGLQRSLDQGATWQDVTVAANLPASAAMGYVSAASSTATSESKPSLAKENSSSKKVAPAPISTPVFRAVTAAGSDVWAGGSSGALYHSLDGGDHWTKVLPSSEGATLTGDVIHLEFSDADHGTVTTSTSEVWLTTDDGQTWQKQ